MATHTEQQLRTSAGEFGGDLARRGSVDSVQEWIEKNIRIVNGLQSIAAHHKLSAETFRKEFARHAGEPVSVFIARVRFRTLERLLRQPDVLIKQAVYEAGFSREDVAARWFRRIAGMSMREYRRTVLGLEVKRGERPDRRSKSSQTEADR